MKPLRIILTAIFAHFIGVSYAQETVDGFTVIAHSYPKTGIYVSSPSICILPDGTYVASHDEFGPGSTETTCAITQVFSSADRGLTWKHISTIRGQFWSNLFYHRGALYIMGTWKQYGNLIIRRSEDGGHTWTEPTDERHGLIRRGQYHTAPVPIVRHRGRLWRACERYGDSVGTWRGSEFEALMMSCREGSDLLDARSWRSSNGVKTDTTWLSGHDGGWLEGNAVVMPDGSVADLLRVDVQRMQTEYAAIVRISRNGKRATFNPDADFVEFQGGSKKFSVRYDSVSKLYIKVNNIVLPKYRKKVVQCVRNTLAISSSPDLRHWTIHKVVATVPEMWRHGFHTIDWRFDGPDIIFVSRTALDDDMGEPNSFHNNNFITFHRVKNWRQYLKETFSVK